MKENREEKQTFAFELVPSRFEATRQLAKHFSSNNAAQLFSTSGNFLGIYPTPYFSLHTIEQTKSKFPELRKWKCHFLTRNIKGGLDLH